eukprot:652748-Rhodomonas_salina.1
MEAKESGRPQTYDSLSTCHTCQRMPAQYQASHSRHVSTWPSFIRCIEGNEADGVVQHLEAADCNSLLCFVIVHLLSCCPSVRLAVADAAALLASVTPLTHKQLTLSSPEQSSSSFSSSNYPPCSRKSNKNTLHCSPQHSTHPSPSSGPALRCSSSSQAHRRHPSPFHHSASIPQMSANTIEGASSAPTTREHSGIPRHPPLASSLHPPSLPSAFFPAKIER